MIPLSLELKGKLIHWRYLAPTHYFTEIRRDSLSKVEWMLNRPTAHIYKSDDVKVIAAELRLIETRYFLFIGHIVCYMRQH